MMLRAQDEKEIKAELLLKAFLDLIDEKLRFVNRGGKRAIQRFSEFFMELCVEKILSVSQSNFIQYIPLYIILKARRSFVSTEDSGAAPAKFDKNKSGELLFLTCFISELIKRSFPEEFLTTRKSTHNNQKSNSSQIPQSKYSSVESRMRAWNYLSSLLAQKDVFDEQILYKSLALII